MPPQIQLSKEQADTLINFANTLLGINKKDNFLLGSEARNKLISGIKKSYNILKPAYGPKGSNVTIETNLIPYNETTNDGKRILDSIQLADPYETRGLNYMREVANDTDKEVGDARKTSAITFSGIVLEGEKIEADLDELKSSLKECLPIILESLDKQSQPISVDKVGQIAEWASENKELGKLFQEIYTKIGKDGIIELSNSNISDTLYEITEGVKLLNCGYHYPYMANSNKGRECVIENPYILITKQKISSIKELDPLLKKLAQQKRYEVVIFCNEIDQTVSSALAHLHINGVKTEVGHVYLKTLVIKAPTLWKDWLFEDFAKISGATIIDGVTLPLKALQIHHLGSVSKITTTKDLTVCIGIKDISEHLTVLNDIGTDEAKIRVARLQTKTAILKLGANSDTELSVLKGKALDGRNSAYLALQGGVVQGAGQSLVNASKELPDTIGGKILKKALLYPNNLLKKYKSETSDPSLALKAAVTHAISVATTVLTTDTVLLQPK